MILSKSALSLIKDKTIRLKLCAALVMTDQTISDYIKANKPNGPLTTYSAMQVIREETGLTDAQILIEPSQVLESRKKKAPLEEVKLIA